jgi:hypothetical protein
MKNINGLMFIFFVVILTTCENEDPLNNKLEISGLNTYLVTYGDSLIIYGNGFPSDNQKVHLKFNNQDIFWAEIYEATNSRLIVHVPDYFLDSVITVKAGIGDNLASAPAPVRYRRTEVTTVTPQNARGQDTVTITGKYISPLALIEKDGHIIKSFRKSPTVISFLASDFSAGLNGLALLSPPFKVSLSFVRTSPKITEIIPSIAFYGDTIELRGEYFGSGYPDTDIRFEPTGFAYPWESIQILESGENSVKFILPTKVFSSTKFVVIADGIETTSDVSLQIKQPVIKDIHPKGHILPGKEIIIDADYFYPHPGERDFGGNYFSYQVKVGDEYADITVESRYRAHFNMPIPKANEITIQMGGFSSQVTTPITSTTSLPGGLRGESVGFSISDVGYITTGWCIANESNKMFAYNNESEKWSEVASFTGPFRHRATAFSLNDKGYVIGGLNALNNPLDDSWQYDPQNDQWTELNTLPFHATEAVVLNGSAYSFSDIEWTRDVDGTIIAENETGGFWLYDQTADTWSKKAPIPNQAIPTKDRFFTMVTNGTLYVGYDKGKGGTYTLYKYSEINDNWILLPNTPFFPMHAYALDFAQTSIVVNDVYILYQFHPENSTWTTLPARLNNTTAGGQLTKFKIGTSWIFGLSAESDWGEGPVVVNGMLKFSEEYWVSD